MNDAYLIAGLLVEDCPMRAVFTDGRVPLTLPDLVRCLLGDDADPTDCYLLAVRVITAEQRAALADMMAAAGQGSLAEARDFLSMARELPIRASHVTGVSMALRAFL